ncbi:M20 family metallopeptidase [uncultured Thermanaerothrix sp.]|uniref:M20 metallopeptidase family protein n=1 Tax=uncultured Thermanaerothrix sp. TaxID=1195149 RepID=UPI0026203130|nr:M20 family metallopeptidase [uncultured Thermanaerothrix sp.]
MKFLLEQAEALFRYTQSLRRDFHRHPELGFQEHRTAGIVARELRNLGLEVTTGVGKTGVVAILDGMHDGPTALLRFDMDALPIQEETGAEYASTHSGVMHACGHDGHTAIGLTVARILAQQREALHGRVKFVFQPAEEGLGGAQAMLEDGVLENPRPDFSLALHLWNEKPVGWVAAVPGPFMAGSDIVEITLRGKGGHGALPHQTRDPIVAAAQLVLALQTIISRNVPPLEVAVLSLTQIHGGEAHNVIPESVQLRGTLRTFASSVRDLVLKRTAQITQELAQAMECDGKIKVTDLTPPVINDEAMAKWVAQVAQDLIPEVNVDTTYRTMVSEDMALMMAQVPGCYFMIGSANPERGLIYGHHHPRFDFDERALIYGVALMCAATLAKLGAR